MGGVAFTSVLGQERSFRFAGNFAAYHLSDKNKQFAAMQAFLKSYPKSHFVQGAQHVTFDDILKITPQNDEAVAKTSEVVLKLAKEIVLPTDPAASAKLLRPQWEGQPHPSRTWS